jgi:predicted nucleic acid-binding protein
VIVVDTNVVVYLFVEGVHTAIAEKVRVEDPDWAAPLLWRSEMRNVLMLYLRNKILTFAEAELHMAKAENVLSGREYQVESARVLALALSSGCTAYDCEFVSLAEKLHVPLVTSDEKLLAAFPKIAVSMAEFAA